MLWLERRLFEKDKPNLNSIEPTITGKHFFSRKSIFVLLSLTALVFAWQAKILFKVNGSFVWGIETDNLFYAEISKCLISTGQENTFTASNLINEVYRYPTPYHYFDLWLNGFVAKISGLNYSLSLYLVTYSFFTVIFLTGLLAFMERYVPIKTKNILLAFLLLFLGGLYVSESILRLNNYCAQMESVVQHYGEKLAPVCCFTLCAIYLLTLDVNSKTGLIIFLCLPVISISLAPAIFGGLILFLIYGFFRKESDKKYYLRLFFYTFIIFSGIVFFYFILKKNDLNYRLDKSLSDYTDLNSGFNFYLKELFLKSYALPFLFLLNYLPFVAVLFYLVFKKPRNKNFRNILILFILLFFCGMMAFNTFYLLDDAYQLFIHVIVMWHVLLGCVFIDFYYKQGAEKKVVKFALTLCFVAGLIFKVCFSVFSIQKSGYKELAFSQNYIDKVYEACLKMQQGTKGAIICGDDFYKNNISTLPVEYYYFPFVLSKNIYIPYNLTYYKSIPENNQFQMEKQLLKSPFNQFVNSSQLSGSEEIQQQQIRFIKETGIKYIICTKGQTLSIDKDLTIKEQITDVVSGQRFIVLQ